MIELTGYKEKHEYINAHGVKSIVYLMDCVDAMAQMSTNQFTLACVDPPYGIGYAKRKGKKKTSKIQYKQKDWDSATPSNEYFKELLRLSENQIVWGGNYFLLPPSRCFIIWGKCQPEGLDQAMCEMAWCSFDGSAKIFKTSVQQMSRTRIHPTQKPVALYDWTFKNYAKPDDTMLDTHLGSGSSRIAADKHNLPFTGIELDPDYFRDHCKRFDNYTSQLTLF